MALAALSGLGGCKPEGQPQKQTVAGAPVVKEDREAIHFAVMGVLNGKLSQINPTSAWIDKTTLAQVDENDRRIEELLVWARALPAGAVRDEYLSWLGWFKSRDDDARADIVNQTTRRHMEKYDKRMKDLFRRADSADIQKP